MPQGESFYAYMCQSKATGKAKKKTQKAKLHFVQDDDTDSASWDADSDDELITFTLTPGEESLHVIRGFSPMYQIDCTLC